MKLPRFTLRDLFWLVLVCALAAGWWREVGRPKREADMWQQNAKYWRGNANSLAETLRSHCDYEVVFDGVPPTP